MPSVGDDDGRARAADGRARLQPRHQKMSNAALAAEVTLPLVPEQSKSGTYFITIISDQRRRVFQTDKNARLFIETISTYRSKGFYRLHAFVVMPDHVHLLLTTGSVTMERAVGMIKGGYSHRLGSKMPVWQAGYRDRRCRDAKEFIAFRDYIHLNPVRAGIAEEAYLYTYSSASQKNGTSAAEAEMNSQL